LEEEYIEIMKEELNVKEVRELARGRGDQ
jgi:hypothetical protein